MQWFSRVTAAVGLSGLPRLRKLIVAVIGGTVVLFGVALIVLPGPAFIVIPVGLAILATEFAWARRAVRRGQVLIAKGAAQRSRRQSALAGGHVAMTNRERVDQLVKALPDVYPDAHCELDFRTPARTSRRDDFIRAMHGQTGQPRDAGALREISHREGLRAGADSNAREK